jgi:hypothetical protein
VTGWSVPRNERDSVSRATFAKNTKKLWVTFSGYVAVFGLPPSIHVSFIYRIIDKSEYAMVIIVKVRRFGFPCLVARAEWFERVWAPLADAVRIDPRWGMPLQSVLFVTVKERFMSELVLKSFRVACTACGLALLVAAMAATASAHPPEAPEIDPGSMSSALTLLIGGLMLVAGRRRKA